MKRRILFCIFTLFLTAVCYAQTNQTESITFTTYYPAPDGVFKNLQLLPSGQPDLSGTEWTGFVYFNETEQSPYFYNGSQWLKIVSGSPGSLGFKVIEGWGYSPFECNGNLSPAPIEGQLCDGLWYMDLLFPGGGFHNGAPDVLVILEEIPDPLNSACAMNMTDQYIAFPTDITETGFRMWVAGSPMHKFSPTPFSPCGWDYKHWHTRAVAGYIASGE